MTIVPRKKIKSTMVHVRITNLELREARKAARKREVTVSHWIRSLIREGIEPSLDSATTE